MRERRVSFDRRTHPVVNEPLSRRGERRGFERRDSPRREIALDVREPGQQSRSCVGDLSIEGAAYVTAAPPVGDLVQLMFTVPTYAGPIIAQGCVVGRQGAERGTLVSITFTDIDVEAQLAIAQWFDDAPHSAPTHAA